MARIFITGAADGLGQLAAKSLADQGHQVVLHARNAERGRDAKQKVPGAEHVITGDLSNLDEIKNIAHEANALGRFDAVIHNAGVYEAPPKDILVVNTIAPYVLTCLIQKPKRLIYLSSGLHLQGRANLENFKKDSRGISYSDSKLYVLMLCMAVAHGNGQMFTPTQSIQGGSQPKWVDVAHRMIFKKDTKHKRGSR